MDKKVYKQIKNSKKIEIFHKVTTDISYTIRIEYIDQKFYLHTFCFQGNDVLDESSYKDEKERFFNSFEDLHLALLNDFPNIRI